MKRKPLLPIIFLLLLCIGFTSCKKEEDKEPTKTDMLAAHEWQGEKALVSGIDVASLPQFSSMFPEISSIRITFRKDGTYSSSYTYNGQAASLSGNWEFRDNETSLFFDLLTSFNIDETLGIKELSTTRLTLTTTVKVQGIDVPAEIYFIPRP